MPITALSRSWFGYALLFCLFVWMGSRISPIFLTGAILVACIEILMCNLENNFYFSLFLISNIRALDELGVTFIPNILMVLPFLKYLIQTHKIPLSVLLCVIGSTIIEFSHSIVLNNWEESVPLICWLLCATYALSVLTNHQITINISGIFYALGGGVILSSATFLLAHSEYLYTLLPSIFAGQRFEAYGNDPNYFSLYICVSLALLFTLPKKKSLDYLLLTCLITIGFLTASKMCMLMMSFILLYALFTQGLRRDVNGKFVRRSLCFLAIVAVCLQRYIIQFIHNLLVRAGLAYGQAMQAGSLTTGRSNIMSNYVSILSNNIAALLLGAGMQYHRFLGEATLHGAHNTYFDIILAWGLIGTVVFGLLLGMVILNARLNFHKSFACYLPLLTLLINFMDLSCFSATMFWFIVVVVLLPFKNFTQQESNYL